MLCGDGACAGRVKPDAGPFYKILAEEFEMKLLSQSLLHPGILTSPLRFLLHEVTAANKGHSLCARRPGDEVPDEFQTTRCPDDRMSSR